jgi:hypothetical protein
MEEIAYCGLVCTKCPAYLGTQTNDKELLNVTAKRWSEMSGMDISADDLLCDGCKSDSERVCVFRGKCDIRACCIEKVLQNCAECDTYVCDKLKGFFEMAPDARESLEELRKKDN